MHFLKWNYFHFKLNFIEICSLGSNWQYVGIGSENGVAPSRRQVIIWTNVDPVHQRISAALGGDELIAPENHINGIVQERRNSIANAL